ncbi:ATP-dependent RNA helicase HrpA [Lacisediminihabitans changchengi]|uniref:ATP-dependent RNA helicase HrpA n=1 Tax=Lacisediminihabitans changchengi TaxID=2787634 RepID=A0A934SKU0_9MICO|nr:ATP-dependent RNA helicase HrpA [Lacisediminihabitans changchengi]MBK4347171.1 ATP-dependent RNA helicase HrpA [Lacisediminihabitans changchengi]
MPDTAAPLDVAITFPEELPVSQRRDDIAAAIRDNQVVIVAGETGSGKTTQLPKILLELGYRSIGHTQPRRIAARTIAERISDELGTPLGGLVGYQVRFTDTVSKDTRVKLMTDGILLNEIHRDRLLRKYDAIIIDEAHERSLTIDFLLGYLKQLMPRRPDLKIIVTSATIDPESFARHFADAAGTPGPIIEVSGRTYPVEVRYRPLVAEVPIDDDEDAAETRADLDPMEGINAAIDELGREGSGDILVFLSGENEIRDAEEAIRGRSLPGTEVLPLYGRLSSAEQHRVFETSRTPGTRRRIVLATNVAETSLTVPGIKYVIDAGTARISRYSVRSKVQRLPIEAISQASANQRSGRSGRTSDGIAIRLYSEEDFLRRPEYTEPEILRTNLAAVILQMISLGLGDIANFPFLQPPDSRGIKDGLDLLLELNAIETPRAERSPSSSKGASTGSVTEPRITRIGKQLTQLPIDPRLARMVIESKQHGTTREVMAIVAALSIQDPRERPLERRPQADQQHARFVDPTSDFLTLLNLWNYLEEKQKELSGNQFRRMCKNEYLNYLRVREWKDVYRQLERMTTQLGLVVTAPSTNPNGIHRSLLAGLLSQIGIKDTASTGKDAKSRDAKGPYIGARQVRFSIFPGSALNKKQPAEIMSAELVETSRLFARTNAAIDLAWAEPIAGDLVKRSYGEPHWEKKQGAAVAYERVTLYGVPIVARRRVQFNRVDPGYARELFIRHALVEGEWDLDRTSVQVKAFDVANRRLRKELAELEERTRRRDILFDDEAVFEFYQRRIPADVSTQRDFESWWKKARQTTPDLLTMTAENLVDEEEATTAVDENAFPSYWQQGDQRLSLRYRFEPGAADDGVTVQVPLALLPGLSPAGFDWQVPGLREELVTALIKALPKAIRRNVVPAADWARKLLLELPATPGSESLATTLAAAIQRLTYVPVTAADFERERVPSHLLVTFAVQDERGKTLAAGKDLRGLQQQLGSSARDSVARASVAAQVSAARPTSALERKGLTSWDFDELPRVLDSKQGGNTIRAYPALVDEGTSVAIRLMSTPADQARELRGGVRRMLQLTIPSPVSYVQEHLTSAEKLSLAQSPYRTTAELFSDCLAACIDAVIDGREIFTKAQFETARDEISATLLDTMFRTVSLVSKVILAGRTDEKAIKNASSVVLLSPLADVREQLGNLVYPGFVSATGLIQLRRLPVYLAGIEHRIAKLGENLGRDRVWMSEVQSATERYLAAGGTLPLAPTLSANIVHARWLLEELRISLFAQQLGTAEPASLQRITKLLST